MIPRNSRINAYGSGANALLNNRRHSRKIREKIIFVLFSIYFSIGILRASNIGFPYWTKFSQIFQLSSLILILVISFFRADNTHTRIRPTIWILFFVGIANLIITKHTFVLAFAILFFGFQKTNFHKLLKDYLTVLNIVFFFVVTLSMIGIIPIGISERENLIRYNLGFQTATLAPSIFFFIVLGHVYLHQKKTSFLYLFFAMVVSIMLYVFTNTRTGFYLTLSICILCLLNKIFSFKSIFRKRTKHSSFNIFIISVPLIALIAEFCLVGYYSTYTEMAFHLNESLSGRLSLTWNLLQTDGFSLFGKNIPSMVNSTYYQSDICYLYYGLNYGIIFMVFTVILEMLVIKKAIRTGDVWLWLAILFIIIDGIFEPYLLDPKYQIFTFIIIDDVLFKKKPSFNNAVARTRRRGE